MRVPSRRLPPWSSAHPGPVARVVGGVFLWLLVVGGAGVLTKAGEMLRWHPVATAVAVVVIVPLCWVVSLAKDVPSAGRLAALVASRPGNALCRFARDFDFRTVDTWLIRATFEEITNGCGKSRGRPIPVRANDHLWKTLPLDGLDIDEIAGSIADRAGYTLDDARSNPMYGKVQTVRDLVGFMVHQPCLRPSRSEIV